jgi:excisionase family DNA binding protein
MPGTGKVVETRGHSVVTSEQLRFYRDRAGKRRELVLLAEAMRRRLTDMAQDCDDRAKEAEIPFEWQGAGQEARLPSASTTVESFTVSIKEAARLLGLGRSTIYRLIGERKLQTARIGNRTLVRTASIRSLPGVEQG